MLIKRIKYTWLLTVMISGFIIHLSAGERDSLESISEKLKNDNERISVYNRLSKIYKDINTGKGLDFGNKALELAIKTDNIKGTATAYKNIGLNSWRSGVYDVALDNYLKSMKINEELRDTLEIASLNNYIGLVYFARGKNDLALDYLNRSINLNKIKNNEIEIARAKHNIGLVMFEKHQFDNALFHHRQSLALANKYGNQNLIASNYCFMGKCFAEMKKSDSAFYYLNKSLIQFDELNSLNDIAMVMNQIGYFHNKTGNYSEAIKYAQRSYNIGDSIGNRFMKLEALGIIHKAYAGQKNFTKGYDVLIEFNELADTLKNEDNIKNIAQKEIQYVYDKRISSLEQNRNELIYRNKLILYISILATVFLFFVALVLFIFYRIRTKANKSLQEKNREIEEQKNEVTQLNSTKDKFFSIIAHDLKSPFNGFLNLTRIMAQNIVDLTDEEKADLSKKMQESAENLYSLLENLLEWSRVQRGIISNNPEPVNLSQIVGSNVSIIEEIAMAKNIRIIRAIPDDAIVYADAPMLNSIIRNLLTNAIKFTPIGGNIELGVNIKSNTIELSVKDDGIGMPENILNNLFKLDVKISRPGTNREPSTGLGLIICKEFAEKIGGSITAKSTENIGSTFILTLIKPE